MQSLLSQRYWGSQPQIITGINWANPITLGLANAVVGAVDYAANRVQPGKVLGQTPRGKTQTATTVYDVSTDTAPITIVGHLRMTSDNNDFNGLLYGQYTPIFRQLAISVQGGSIYVINRQGSSGANIYASYTLPLDEVFGLSCVFGGGSNVTWYRNGILQSNAIPAFGTSAFAQGSYNQLWVASSSNVGAESTGKSSAWCCRWTRVLSDAEVKSVSDNPWQLFRALI